MALTIKHSIMLENSTQHMGKTENLSKSLHPKCLALKNFTNLQTASADTLKENKQHLRSHKLKYKETSQIRVHIMQHPSDFNATVLTKNQNL